MGSSMELEGNYLNKKYHFLTLRCRLSHDKYCWKQDVSAVLLMHSTYAIKIILGDRLFLKILLSKMALPKITVFMDRNHVLICCFLALFLNQFDNNVFISLVYTYDDCQTNFSQFIVFFYGKLSRKVLLALWFAFLYYLFF